MQTPGRDTIFKTGYRYGFNGKEADNEPYGQGNEYDYGFRIYNPRIGRFLSVDPLTQKYPELTPYQFASNNPVKFVDLDGLEADPGEQMLLSEPAGVPEQEIRSAKSKNIYVNILKGGAKGVFTTFGLVTEIIGREEYGNRIKNPDPYRDFPLIGNKNYIEIAKEIIASPAVLITELDKNPDNTELWGEAIVLVAIAGEGKFKDMVREKRTYTVLSKTQRLELFQKALEKSKPASSQTEAIALINNTLDAVEDLYSGIEKAPGIPKGDDGRMYGILDEKYVTTQPDGTKIAQTKGNRVVLSKDGGIEIQTQDGSKTLFKKEGAKPTPPNSNK